ncbi:hypothetical protein ABPG73_008022 [Tetrahymena malaccensis]
MINKFITVNIILLLLSLINANDQCVLIEGCLSCVENTNNQIQCTKCDIDYQLDTEKNVCIYSKCSNYQFYDKNQYDGTEDSGCVAICNTSSQQDEKINLCKSQQQCNTSKLSQKIIQEQVKLNDFFIYQNDYYVAQKEGSFFVYNRTDVSLVKNIQFLDKDAFVFQINSRIFIKGNDNSLSTWDIMIDFRKSILYQNLISFKSLEQINFIFNRYVIAYNIQQQQIEFQIFYDEIDQAFSLSNSFTINVNAKTVKLIDTYIFIYDSQNFLIYQITTNYDENNLLHLQIEFIFQFINYMQDRTFSQIISTPQIGIYYLAIEPIIHQVNINENSNFVAVGFNDVLIINKLKLFQASDTDQYLVILQDNKQLFQVSLQTFLKITIIVSDNVDFEIYNLWGQQNQLIVLLNNQELQFYELDQNQQQFILIKQKYVLSYRANSINLIKYLNQSSAKNQITQEIATLSFDTIQIIKQGNLWQQERQLVSVQIISNMNLPFPIRYLALQNGNTDYVLIYQYPPLIIQLFPPDQILFYDLLENNCKFQKIIITLNDYELKIHSQDFTLLYQTDSLPISNLQSIDQIINDNQTYLLYGQEGTVIVDIQQNTQTFLSSQLNVYEQITKKANLNGKIYYSAYTKDYKYIYEYFIDIQTNIIQISARDYIDQDVYIGGYFVQQQNLSNPKNSKIIGFQSKAGLIYLALFQNSKYYKLDLSDYEMNNSVSITTSVLSGKYFIFNQKSVYSFDLFNNSLNQIVIKDINLARIDVQDKYLIYMYQGVVFVNLFSNKQSTFQDMKIINGYIYDSQNNIFYIFGSNILVLNDQLAIAQTIVEEKEDINYSNCKNLQKKIICLCNINSSSIFIYDKIQKTSQIVNIMDQNLQYLFDDKYENIFAISRYSNIKIFSYEGIMKQVINERYENCYICSEYQIACTFTELVTFIDRQTLGILNTDIRDSSGFISVFFCIEQLNYVVFNTSDKKDSLSVFDISTQKIVLSFSIVKQNSINDHRIIDWYYDKSSIRYFMFLDSEGTIYLSSLDPKLPFQSYVKINEFNDQKEQIQRFFYDGITNDVYIVSDKSIYKLDYNLLGSQFEPVFNDPQDLIAEISIYGKETDYLIMNTNNILFRYTQQQVKFEIAVSNDQRIIEIKYNKNSDILIIGLEDSILFYQKYQQSKNDNIFPILYKLENVKLQQFIIDFIIVTFESKILHLNIEQGLIIKEIQFNITQLVSSFTFNTNQDLILVGFTDGQLLQYSLVSQIYSFYNTTQYDSIQNLIINIQFIEILGVQQFAYAISNGALVFKIDTINIKIVSQIDLRHLVNEDQSLSLTHFINDYTYQRYIFCFSGQKKAYVWNYSNNQQEQNLLLPKIKVNKLGIEKNFVYIQCSFQVNLYTLGPKIQLFTIVKKDFIEDKITLFKLFTSNIFTIFFINKFELFILNGNNITMVAQQSYQYPQILSYQFDSKSNILSVIGLHQTGIFDNTYNLDIYFKESISECTALISSKNYEFIKQELSYISPKQKEIYSLNGITLVDQQNWQSQVYLKIYSNQISNVFQQISQQKENKFIYSPIDMQNNSIALRNDTFQNLGQVTLKLLDFNFNFENNTNLFINITQNQFTKQIIIQNMTINLNSISSNQIYISNIEKVFIYNLEVSYNNFLQTTQKPIFQFDLIENILIKGKPIQLKIDKKLPQVPYNASINNDNNIQVLSPIAADSQQKFI